MQIRLKSFRQTIQACARENTFQDNKLGLIDGPICRLFCDFFLIPAQTDSLYASVSQKNWISIFFICWQINFFRPLRIYLSVAKHFLHSRPKGGIIILDSLDFSREDRIFVCPFHHILVYMKMQIGLQRCTERLYPQWSNHFDQREWVTVSHIPNGRMFRNLK